jgi:hypothetical protein
MRVKTIDPEHGIVDAVADAVGSDAVWHLSHAPETERAQSRVIEYSRSAHVGDPDAGVIDHRGFPG